MADLKISQFDDGGPILPTDEIATNRSGVNTKVFVGTAAALDVGTSVGDVIQLIDIGGNSGLPALDGSLITNVSSSNITVADTTDTTCWVVLVENQTGNQSPKTDGGFTYNASTGTAGVNISGNAATATTATTLQTARTIGGVSFNGSANIVPQTIQVADAASAASTYVLLVSSATGDLQPLTDSGIAYNASTNILTVNISGRVINEPVTTANSGTSYALNLSNGPNFVITLTGNCTFTITNPPANASAFNLVLKQDGSGSKTVTWPSSVDWALGSAPTISSAANSVDIFTFYTVDGGTNWFGFMAGRSMA